MSEVDIIIDGENCVCFNARKWQETIVEAVSTSGDYLPGRRVHNLSKSESTNLVRGQYIPQVELQYQATACHLEGEMDYSTPL